MQVGKFRAGLVGGLPERDLAREAVVTGRQPGVRGAQMPIFEYHCSGCGLDFERLVRSQGELVECPECRSAKVRKQLSVVAAPRGKSGGAGDSGGSCCAGGGCGCTD
jgi:putative FmdB family regulatory protein